MQIARSQNKLIQELNTARGGSTQPRVALVTCKGKCHDGHGAIINAARTLSDFVVVAFIPHHTHATDNVVSASEFHDIGFVEKHKADLLYLPSTEQLFATGFAGSAQIHLPTSIDAQGHYSYFLTTQIKLINLIQPDVVVSGEKQCERNHYLQQAMQDLGLRATLQLIPTVRHANGGIVDHGYDALPDPDKAGLLYETLKNAAHAISAGARNFNKIENTARVALRGGDIQVKNFSILDNTNFQPAQQDTRDFRLVAEVEVDQVALKDNLRLTL